MASIGDPIPMQFLPLADETWEVITDDLVRGYQLPSYPGTCIGSGKWFVLADDDTIAGVVLDELGRWVWNPAYQRVRPDQLHCNCIGDPHHARTGLLRPRHVCAPRG